MEEEGKRGKEKTDKKDTGREREKTIKIEIKEGKCRREREKSERNKKESKIME